jgi:hypothetical protein
MFRLTPSARRLSSEFMECDKHISQSVLVKFRTRLLTAVITHRNAFYIFALVYSEP